MIDFTNIKYLQHGTERQNEVFQLLEQSQLLAQLESYEPILIGSIPLGLDLPSSDIDVICQFERKDQFINHITSKFSQEELFIVREFFMYGVETVTANFEVKGLEVEIFGQEIPTKQQMGYKHLITEYELLQLHGESFRNRIMELKKSGRKTEEAFCDVLGIQGNPYLNLIDLRNH